MKKKKKHELMWITKDQKPVSCDETNKVLNENFLEITLIVQSAFDDAILMGCDEDDFKKKISNFVNKLKFSIGKN